MLGGGGEGGSLLGQAACATLTLVERRLRLVITEAVVRGEEGEGGWGRGREGGVREGMEGGDHTWRWSAQPGRCQGDYRLSETLDQTLQGGR